MRCATQPIPSGSILRPRRFWRPAANESPACPSAAAVAARDSPRATRCMSVPPVERFGGLQSRHLEVYLCTHIHQAAGIVKKSEVVSRRKFILKTLLSLLPILLYPFNIFVLPVSERDWAKDHMATDARLTASTPFLGIRPGCLVHVDPGRGDWRCLRLARQSADSTRQKFRTQQQTASLPNVTV